MTHMGGPGNSLFPHMAMTAMYTSSWTYGGRGVWSIAGAITKSEGEGWALIIYTRMGYGAQLGMFQYA